MGQKFLVSIRSSAYCTHWKLFVVPGVLTSYTIFQWINSMLLICVCVCVWTAYNRRSVRVNILNGNSSLFRQTRRAYQMLELLSAKAQAQLLCANNQKQLNNLFHLSLTFYVNICLFLYLFFITATVYMCVCSCVASFKFSKYIPYRPERTYRNVLVVRISHIEHIWLFPLCLLFYICSMCNETQSAPFALPPSSPPHTPDLPAIHFDKTVNYANCLPKKKLLTNTLKKK